MFSVFAFGVALPIAAQTSEEPSAFDQLWPELRGQTPESQLGILEREMLSQGEDADAMLVEAFGRLGGLARSGILDLIVAHEWSTLATWLNRGLDDEDPSVRLTAAEHYRGRIEGRAYGKLSYMMFYDPIESVRLAAAIALRDDGEVPIETSLSDAVSDPEDEVRARAILLIGQLGYDRLVHELFEKMRDPSARVRVAAARALTAIGGERAVEALLLGLDDLSSDVVRVCRRGLEDIVDRSHVLMLVGFLNNRSAEVRLEALQLLEGLSDARIAEFVAMKLQDWDPRVIGVACRMLAGYGAVQYVPQLKTLALSHDAASVRMAATHALGQMPDSAGGNALVDVSLSNDVEVVILAMEHLIDLEFQPFYRYAIDLSSARDSRVRGRAYEAILTLMADGISAHRIFEIAGEALDEREALYRLYGVQIIIKMEHEHRHRVLVDLLRDRDEAIRREVLIALTESLGKQGSYVYLTVLNNDRSDSLKVMALRALAEYQLTQSEPSVRNYVTHSDAMLSATARGVLLVFGHEEFREDVLAQVASENRRLRFAGLRSLGQVRQPWAADQLRAIIDDTAVDARPPIEEIYYQYYSAESDAEESAGDWR